MITRANLFCNIAGLPCSNTLKRFVKNDGALEGARRVAHIERNDAGLMVSWLAIELLGNSPLVWHSPRLALYHTHSRFLKIIAYSNKEEQSSDGNATESTNHCGF